MGLRTLVEIALRNGHRQRYGQFLEDRKFLNTALRADLPGKGASLRQVEATLKDGSTAQATFDPSRARSDVYIKVTRVLDPHGESKPIGTVITDYTSGYLSPKAGRPCFVVQFCQEAGEETKLIRQPLGRLKEAIHELANAARRAQGVSEVVAHQPGLRECVALGLQKLAQVARLVK